MNLLATVGAFVFFASFLLLAFNIWRSLRDGALAGPNPWNAGTLEWATASPPPAYNFAYIPVCTDREPLWETPEPPVAVGLRADRREFIVTTLVDAEPDMRESSPPDSIWPLVAALVTSVTLLASIFTPWAIVWGLLPVGAALTMWFWPKGAKEEQS
jgi:cytochrome c oxidase subunit 1